MSCWNCGAGIPAVDAMCPDCGVDEEQTEFNKAFQRAATPDARPSAEPMPEGSRDYRFGGLCEALVVLPIDMGTLLRRFGFAIVPTADVPSAEERLQLETIRNTTSATLDGTLGNAYAPQWVKRICVAELARRAAKERK